jgi:hypothetical protein
MKKLTGFLLSFIFVSAFVSYPSFSQGKKTVTPSMVLQYIRTNEKASLTSKLTYPGEKGDMPLPGMEISFFTTGGSKALAAIHTDETGTATYIIDENTKLPADESGSWKFRSEFSGKDTIDATSAEVSVRDVTLEMTLSLVDTVKTVTLEAFTFEKGKKVAVKGEVVNVFVPRMFSNLPVADVKLDDKGTARVAFPSDIPGDKDGNITIVARFTEHPVFGNVERRLTEKWGVPTSYSVPLVHRALWTKTPPMWMIVTLSILLTGVWGHYMFAIISLILIRIDAKREKKAKDE